MTKNKKMREQVAFHTYKQQVTVGSVKNVYSANMRSFHEATTESNKGEHRKEAHGSRVVTTVPKVDPSTAWQTFAQRRHARNRPQRISRLVPRSLVQTGMRASSGRMKAIPRPLPQHSPVPMRSGRHKARRGFFWKVVGALAFCISAFLLTGFAFTNTAFRIAQVNVVGTHNEALINSIQRMGMQGQNIFLLNVALLKGRIEASPLVASATLSKQWPNQLTVTVVERTPILLWQTPQGTYSIDRRGMVIAPIGNSSVSSLGTVVDITNSGKQNSQAAKAVQTVHPGGYIDPATVDFAVNVFNRLPKVTGITLFKLHYDGTMYASTSDEFGGAGSKGSFIVESSDGWKAYLGGAHDANPLDNRLNELQQILALAQKKQLNLATIDLRYGLRPVYTLK